MNSAMSDSKILNMPMPTESDIYYITKALEKRDRKARRKHILDVREGFLFYLKTLEMSSNHSYKSLCRNLVS